MDRWKICTMLCVLWQMSRDSNRFSRTRPEPTPPCPLGKRNETYSVHTAMGWDRLAAWVNYLPNNNHRQVARLAMPEIGNGTGAHRHCHWRICLGPPSNRHTAFSLIPILALLPPLFLGPTLLRARGALRRVGRRRFINSCQI